MTSAMITEPASPEKLALIREFMRLSGLQSKIDGAEALRAATFPGGPLVTKVLADHEEALGDITYNDFLAGPFRVAAQVYSKHRDVWQEEYEHHLNWEYAEEELRALVDFFSSPVGRRFREAEWRMNAYVGTNTEHLVAEILEETAEVLSDPAAWRG